VSPLTEVEGNNKASSTIDEAEGSGHQRLLGAQGLSRFHYTIFFTFLLYI
jgi:hypothetical protein